MKLKILLPIITLVSTMCYCQKEKTWNIDIGYSGSNIVHPGINTGAIKTIKSIEKVRKNGKIIKKENLIGGRAGFYFHRNYQTGLWLQGEIAHLRSKSDKRYHTFSLGIGCVETWVPKVYSINNQGDVEYSRAKGIFYGMVSPAFEWGWNFKKENKTLNSWYIRPKLQFQFPYFLGTNEYLLFEIGIHLK